MSPQVRAEHCKLSWEPPEDDGGCPIQGSDSHRPFDIYYFNSICYSIYYSDPIEYKAVPKYVGDLYVLVHFKKANRFHAFFDVGMTSKSILEKRFHILHVSFFSRKFFFVSEN
jgi:hypothetical protein